MAPRTIFLARLIGLFMVLFALSMLAHRQATVATFTSLVQDADALLLFGVVALTVGLAMVLGHNVWTGGPLPVAVTVIGWIILIRGMLLTFLPTPIIVELFDRVRFAEFFLLYEGLILAVGAWLAGAGFLARPAAPD